MIIPVYNAAENLPETLRSLEAQTSDDWDAVICDDASTDDTSAVARSFGERFRVVQTRPTWAPRAPATTPSRRPAAS